MILKLSKNGAIVIPAKIPQQLNLRPGDEFDARIDSGRIVLLVKKRPKGTARIIKDPLTGLPVLTAGRNARVLTSDDVAKILEDFP
jgi:AbrB family looped-hinge helix DNA binding protein